MLLGYRPLLSFPPSKILRCCTVHLLLDLCKNFGVLEQEVLLGEWSAPCRDVQAWDTSTHLFANLDRVSAPARKEYAITSLHSGGNDGSVLIRCTRANGNDGGLREGVACRRRGEEDPTGGFLERPSKHASHHRLHI